MKKLALLSIAAVLAAGPAFAGNTIFLTDRNAAVTFPFSPPNRATSGPGAIDNMIIGAVTPKAGYFTTFNFQSQACTATPCVEQGLNAAQGGAISTVGGTSSTSANAGGAASVIGGVPGATGIGGAAAVTGGAGGATSGAGGAASLTGGVGTAGNAAGGAVSETGGTGQGSAAGGAAAVTGGVGGATGAGGAVNVAGGAGGATSGNGGVTTVQGGAAAAGNGNGGSLVLQGGALNGSGANGSVREINLVLRTSATAAANAAATLTAAQMTGGVIQSTPVAGINLQLPLATAMDTAIPDSIATDSFDFSIINTSAGANTVTVTTNTGWTFVGTITIAQNVSGRFRALKTGTGAWTLLRIS